MRITRQRGRRQNGPNLPRSRKRFSHLILASVALGATTSCSPASPSLLDTVGPDAKRVENLWWLMLALASGVLIVVLVVLIGAIARGGRRGDDELNASAGAGRRLVILGGVVMPILVLTVVFVIATVDLGALSADAATGTEIHVTGKQWWWEVVYPGTDVVTANEIHVPVGERIRFTLDSADVIHSFWVPQAGAKRDMIPGHTNELTLSFDRPGTFRGICSEFCGLQHAKMQFLVVAQPRDEFEAWLQEQAKPALEPKTPEETHGRDLFTGGSCAGCHDIRGVSDADTTGPDLTHLASRSTIAAATLDLDHQNLIAWVDDPATLKPGVLMPAAGLDHEQLDDLVAYLESLR